MLNYLTLGLFQNPLCLPSQLLLLPRPVSTPFCLMQHFLHSALATFFGVPMVKYSALAAFFGVPMVF